MRGNRILHHSRRWGSKKDYLLASLFLSGVLSTIGLVNSKPSLAATTKHPQGTVAQTNNTTVMNTAQAAATKNTVKVNQNGGVQAATGAVNAQTQNQPINVAVTQNTNNINLNNVQVNANQQVVTTNTNAVKQKVAREFSRSQVAVNNQNSSTQTTKAQLNTQAAQVVRNAGINASTLTNDQVTQLNKVKFSGNVTDGTSLSLWDLEQVGQTMLNHNAKFAIPYFNGHYIKNFPAAHAVDAETGEKVDLDIWDSWPVETKSGAVAKWHGYQIVIGMMGEPKRNDAHLYLLYNKYGDNNFKHWKNAGSIFGNNESAAKQEWSGSAIVNSDGTIQLYFTLVDTSQGGNNQQIATCTLHLVRGKHGKLSIGKVTNLHVLFTGDGYYYQTSNQAKGVSGDDFCLRDAHVVQMADGTRYLVFEGNTGTQDYQSANQIYDWQNYGGSDSFNVKEFLNYSSKGTDHDLASVANAAIGILRLTNSEDDPQVAQVYPPLITALMVSDELERPDVLKLNGKYYLFTDTRLSRGSNSELTAEVNKKVGDNVAMLGFVSNSLFGPYKPLNGDGGVLVASVPFNWRTSTYSYYATMVPGSSNKVLITSYMSNRGEVAGQGLNSTWSPSFLVQLNRNNTTTVLAKMTQQGVWVWTNKAEDAKYAGTYQTAQMNSNSVLQNKSTLQKTNTGTTQNKMVMHDAYVYNAKGQRVGKTVLRSGSVISIYSFNTKKIKGGRYYEIGHNKYVSTSNIDGRSRTAQRNAYVYNKNGQRTKVRMVKVGSKVKTYGSPVRIKGKLYYVVGKNRYLKKANF